MLLTDDDLTRYARHIVLKEIGGRGQARLKAASVAVIGAGGIGSPAIAYLAAAGIGRLLLVDDDRLDTSNLARQTIYASADVGTAKVAAAAAAVERLNPGVAVAAHTLRLNAGNVAALLDDVDVVLDGSDNFDTRLTVADAALARRVPLVSSAVVQFEGQIGVFRGWEADKPCYRCFVGDAPGRDAASCADDGVLGPVAGVMGSLAALEVIRALVPFGDDMAGRLLLVDALAMRFRTLVLPKDPGCRACGTTTA
jgi:molybdopterin/thiamine biosynthesis adenylyltransferase